MADQETENTRVGFVMGYWFGVGAMGVASMLGFRAFAVGLVMVFPFAVAGLFIRKP